MTLTLTAPPAAEPVALADIKTFLKIEHDDDDALIGALIAAARLHVEAAVRRVLVSQGWRLTLDAWPPPAGAGRQIDIPLGPVLAIGSLAVLDPEGVAVPLDPAAWTADTAGIPARLLVRDAPPPGVPLGGIRIDYTAGYGDPAEVPAPLVQAVRLIAAHWYETREPVAFGGPANMVPETIAALIAPYRVRWL
ncbi:putative phiE125 gp8 family phage protein [Tepidamorphus gemmatus]|uniref:Putative phiE125 gp8 family phage protein n=1 Tax=Tepidamorphus gemmatus TaxID=747076 RepID=A0A4V2UXA9_9HYPH|nr:head-tail connector protein [Tepidamorphus gemmatus]TCT02818.1 putative phiE125 gp8 family phage protein [Tepidamorphus gemmatus]